MIGRRQTRPWEHQQEGAGPARTQGRFYPPAPSARRASRAWWFLSDHPPGLCVGLRAGTCRGCPTSSSRAIRAARA